MLTDPGAHRGSLKESYEQICFLHKFLQENTFKTNKCYILKRELPTL